MGQEYYDEAGVPIRSRFTYGFVEPAHTEKVLLMDSSGRPLIVVEANDITKWGGTALTGRDISADLANLDVALSTRLKPDDLNLDGDKDIQVDVKSSALPAGAATETTLGTRALESGGNLANIKTNTDKLDINLSRAALAANVAQYNASATWGLNNLDWSDSGTPIPASTIDTLLEISGFGKITFVMTMNDEHVNMHERIYLDSVQVNPDCYCPGYINNKWGVTKHGFVDLWKYDSGNQKYGITWHVGELGSFGSSAKVDVNNLEGVTHKVYIRANYFVSTSEEFTIDNPVVSDPALVRKDLANTLGIDLEHITAIYQVDWNEELGKNVPSLSTIVHSKLSPAGENTVTSFLNDRKAK